MCVNYIDKIQNICDKSISTSTVDYGEKKLIWYFRVYAVKNEKKFL